MFRRVRFAAPAAGPALGGKHGSPWESDAAVAREMEARGKTGHRRTLKHGTPWDGRAAGLAGRMWKPVGKSAAARSPDRRRPYRKQHCVSAICAARLGMVIRRRPPPANLVVIPRASMVRPGNLSASHQLPPLPQRTGHSRLSHGLPYLPGHSHRLPGRCHTGFHNWRSRPAGRFPRASTPPDSPFPPASASRRDNPTVFHPPTSTIAVNQGIA